MGAHEGPHRYTYLPSFFPSCMGAFMNHFLGWGKEEIELTCNTTTVSLWVTTTIQPHTIPGFDLQAQRPSPRTQRDSYLKFLGIVGQDPSVSNSDWLHAMFKIEALMWVSFWRVPKFQPFSWKVGSNPTRQSKNIRMKYKARIKLEHELYGTRFPYNGKN